LNQELKETEDKQYTIVYQNDDVIIAMRVRDDVGGEEE
jgi:hypothetical protein